MAVGTVAELEDSRDSFVREYFHGLAEGGLVHPPGEPGEPGGGGPPIPHPPVDLWED